MLTRTHRECFFFPFFFFFLFSYFSILFLLFFPFICLSYICALYFVHNQVFIFSSYFITHIFISSSYSFSSPFLCSACTFILPSFVSDYEAKFAATPRWWLAKLHTSRHLKACCSFHRPFNSQERRKTNTDDPELLVTLQTCNCLLPADGRRGNARSV